MFKTKTMINTKELYNDFRYNFALCNQSKYSLTYQRRHNENTSSIESLISSSIINLRGMLMISWLIYNAFVSKKGMCE